MPSLDYNNLLRSIPKAEFQPAYFFYGDEDLLKHDAVEQLVARALDPSSRDFNFERHRAADLTADVVETLTLTPPILANLRVAVITEAEDLQQRRSRAQAARAALLSYLARPVPETLIIMVQSAGANPDEELQAACTSVNFAPLAPERLHKWISVRASRHGLTLEDEAISHLLEAVHYDLPTLAAEIAKMASAVQGRPATVDDVTDLVGVRRGETVSDFVDAVTARRFTEALPMLPHLLETPGTSGVWLVTALGLALVGVALARAQLDRGASSSVAADAVKQSLFSSRPKTTKPYGELSKQWASDAGRWTSAGLDQALSELLKADRRLKSTRIDDDQQVLRGALLAMAGAEVRAA